MKILVFSDTHGNPKCMLHAVKLHIAAGPVARIVHLGDGYRDFSLIRERYPDIPMTQVAGNGEDVLFGAHPPIPYSEIFTEGGITFFATHGHRLQVKNDLENAANAGARAGADVVLFGHTHVAEDTRMDTIYGKKVRLINPGSAGSGYKPRYAVLEIDNGVLLCGFGVDMDLESADFE